MNRLIAFSLLLGAGLLSGAIVDAQKDPAAIDIQKVANNLYVVTGGRGTGSSSNTVSGCTTVFITNTGVVLVDTKLPGFANAILEKVKSVTTKWAELQEYQDFTREFVASAQASMKAGRTIDQAVAEMKLPANRLWALGSRLQDFRLRASGLHQYQPFVRDLDRLDRDIV